MTTAKTSSVVKTSKPAVKTRTGKSKKAKPFDYKSFARTSEMVMPTLVEIIQPMLSEVIEINGSAKINNRVQ
ncbi:MAG: hypothetical protein LBI42_06560 [Chitinispirillales bacterium]|jgi:hypothetical protein|nr:hypothetical protein [Chitinispirillales bacterium]